jgi:hypothetical protein
MWIRERREILIKAAVPGQVKDVLTSLPTHKNNDIGELLPKTGKPCWLARRTRRVLAQGVPALDITR